MNCNNVFRANRHGLTLLELVVVMTILIALAGILVAMFPGMLSMAHTSTSATNMPELNKIFQMHHQVQRGWPNYLDNLVVSSGTLYTKLPGYEEGHGYFLEPHELTHDQAHALRDAGLTHVFNLAVAEAVDDATYDCYGSGVVSPELSEAAPVNDHLTVARLTNPSDVAKFKGDLDHVYVVFGIGQATPLVGPGGMMQDAPIHFDDAPGTRPNQAYSRFVAIFDLGEPHDDDDDDDDLHRHGRAKFVTCAALHRSGIAVPWMPLKGFHHSDHSH